MIGLRKEQFDNYLIDIKYPISREKAFVDFTSTKI
jgi:hypothetical protein